jgi:hypothetical protein
MDQGLLNHRAHPTQYGGSGAGAQTTPSNGRVSSTGMTTGDGTDIRVTDGGDVATVGGEVTGVIRGSHWRDA